MTLIARTEGEPTAVIGPLRDVVRSLDINVPVYRVETMEELFEQRSLAVGNLIGGITTTVGLVGLCLALIGVYAVVSYQEIGIRMAVGAVRSQVLGMILKHAATMGIIGVAIGTAISFAGGRGLTVGLGVPRFDPLLFSLVPIVLLATTLLAALVPARRAATIDPQQVLRND
jgi:ABC-type antimicrobial peptide transport system permease subunit